MAGLLEPRAFVWCIAGPHIGETLTEIVERKRQDIQEFGWCLWAYAMSTLKPRYAGWPPNTELKVAFRS
jgi:hypothetical protein